LAYHKTYTTNMSLLIDAAAAALAKVTRTVNLYFEVDKAQKLVAQHRAFLHKQKLEAEAAARLVAIDNLFEIRDPVRIAEIYAARRARRAAKSAYKANAAIRKSRRRDNAIGATWLARRRNLRVLRAIARSLISPAARVRRFIARNSP
jgi:hypothetical protein